MNVKRRGTHAKNKNSDNTEPLEKKMARRGKKGKIEKPIEVGAGNKIQKRDKGKSYLFWGGGRLGVAGGFRVKLKKTNYKHFRVGH